MASCQSTFGELCTRIKVSWYGFWICLLVHKTWTINANTLQSNAKEYCNMEMFNATCKADEVVVMGTARYGRMRIGHCVKGGYGHLGCAVDILGYMDGRCSGEHVCRFKVPDTEMYKTKPCPEDFTSYLEASYECVKVATAEARQCHRRQPILVQNMSGFIASKITQELALGSIQCPWVIEVNPGQRINVSLYNFVRSYKISTSGMPRPVNMDVCFDVVQITEGLSERKVVNLCGRNNRISEVYMSKTNQIKIAFLDRGLLREVGNFVLKYEAVSCPDVRPPPEAWVRRDGDTLMISCNATQEKWYLTCSHDSWVGEIGNCTVPKKEEREWSLTHVFSEEEIFPYGILVVVAIGVLLGVLIGGVLLVVIFIMSKSRSKRRQENSAFKDNKENLRILDSTNSNNGALGTTNLPVWMREGQYTDEGIVRDIRSPLPTRDRPLPEEHVIIQGDAHLHINPHICDVIPVSEPMSTFQKRTHYYEAPSVS